MEPTATGIDQVENRKHTQAMNLFRRILTDLPHEGFTLQDVRDSFNACTRLGHLTAIKNTRLKTVRYGISHLKYLVENGFLVYNDQIKKYRVNSENDFVAREIMYTDEDITSLEELN